MKKRRRRKRWKRPSLAELRAQVRLALVRFGAAVPNGWHLTKFVNKMTVEEISTLIKELASAKLDLLKMEADYSHQKAAETILAENKIENVFELLANAISAMHEDDKMSHPVFDEITVMLKNMYGIFSIGSWHHTHALL